MIIQWNIERKKHGGKIEKGTVYRLSKKTLWKFNRLSCIINVDKQLHFYIGRKNS